jgi:hypothetical protein
VESRRIRHGVDHVVPVLDGGGQALHLLHELGDPAQAVPEQALEAGLDLLEDGAGDPVLGDPRLLEAPGPVDRLHLVRAEEDDAEQVAHGLVLPVLGEAQEVAQLKVLDVANVLGGLRGLRREHPRGRGVLLGTFRSFVAVHLLFFAFVVLLEKSLPLGTSLLGRGSGSVFLLLLFFLLPLRQRIFVGVVVVEGAMAAAYPAATAGSSLDAARHDCDCGSFGYKPLLFSPLAARWLVREGKLPDCWLRQRIRQ